MFDNWNVLVCVIESNISPAIVILFINFNAYMYSITLYLMVLSDLCQTPDLTYALQADVSDLSSRHSRLNH